MSSVSKYVVFKPVTGGYVCRPPGSWVFGAGVHLLANESSVKNASERRFTQGVVAISGDRVSITGRVKVRRASGGAG
jgi:hypothetical protein